MLNDEKITRLACAIDRLMYDYDSLTYWNQVDDVEENIQRIKVDIEHGAESTEDFLLKIANGEQEFESEWIVSRARRLLTLLKQIE